MFGTARTHARVRPWLLNLLLERSRKVASTQIQAAPQFAVHHHFSLCLEVDRVRGSTFEATCPVRRTR